MSKITFVFDYEGVTPPSLHALMTFEGGKIVSAVFGDAIEENEKLNEQIEELKEDSQYGEFTCFN